MCPRASLPRTSLLITGLLLVATLVPVSSAPVFAQGATPATPSPTANVTASPTGPTPTPTVTRTPTITPSPTATFTTLQTRLALGQAYLKGGEYAKAADIFSAVALEDHGNPEAMAGLDAALAGQAAATATAGAPRPTIAATATPVPTGPTFGTTLTTKVGQFVAVAVAVLVMVLLLYLLARGLRWLLSYLRELWWTRIRRPSVGPGYLVGEFVAAAGEEAFQGPKIVAQALTEQLVSWNQAVQGELRSPVAVDLLDAPGLAWLGRLWSQVFVPARAFKVRGVLYGKQPGPYRLFLERVDLRTNKVDASHTFESGADAPGQAFRELGMTAAFWVRDPSGMEASPDMLEMPSKTSGLSGVAIVAAERTPSQIASDALKLLGAVKQQVNLGNVDYTSAPRSLMEAQTLIERLPATAKLRQELQSAIDDLWHRVQPGRIHPGT